LFQIGGFDSNQINQVSVVKANGIRNAERVKITQFPETPPSSAEVKNAWNYTSTPHTSSFRAA